MDIRISKVWMELKLISIVALLLFILNLQCKLSLGKGSDSVGAAASNRNARQGYDYYYYDYYTTSYPYYDYYDYNYYDYNYYDYYTTGYPYYYYTGSYVAGWVYVAGIFGCCIICLPCIITAIVLCCCCALGGKRTNHTITTTTTTGYTEFHEKQEPIVYPQVGYPQPVQANIQYPTAGQGYYPNTAPADPVESQDGLYPTDKLLPPTT
ncbi:hypothetical protein LOD99_2468 [Oopsacas minuta]|uniref:Uncharacterized protein n=1 Tax=Oopsacas minuta TaxID=111878 RepID=A0AAV7K398_9METZ|nr:hypothetical protein LOD99_2468 [Oopsacas minuta]